MKSYSDYKDSGVGWIGDIPSSWNISRLNFFLELIVEKDIPSDNDVKISPEYVESYTGKVMNYHSNYGTVGVKFQKGDTLLNKLGVYLSKFVFCELDGFSMGEMIVLRPRKYLPKYQYYLLANPKIIDYFNSLSQGVKMPRTPVYEVLNTYCPVPPPLEQKQISAYLDSKTQQIDVLIEKTERKIELLKEQRSSLIYHCVTKGLDANVEVKDSGVEWIGDIPSSWKVGRLNFLLELIVEKGLPSNDDVKISPEYVESYTGKVMNYHSDYGIMGMKFQKGDTLLNKLRVYLSKFVFCELDGFSMGEMIVLRPRKYLPKYQYYLLANPKIIDYFNSLSQGVKMPRPPIYEMLNSYCPVPPFPEQKQISDYLDYETLKIDLMVDIETKRVELLKEYRRCLIARVVTGKIDVRDEAGQ